MLDHVYLQFRVAVYRFDYTPRVAGRVVETSS